MPRASFRAIVLSVGFALAILHYFVFQALVTSGQLPDPIAIHWGFGGNPDGFSDATSYGVGITIVYFVLLALLAYFAFGVRRRLLSPLLFGTVAFLFVFLYAIFSITIVIQIGRAPTEAVLEPWLLFGLLALPLGLAGLALGNPNVTFGDKLQIRVRGLSVLQLDYSELVSAREISMRARDFGGLGIRYGNKTLAFIPKPGPGVLIETNFGESVAIRSNQPENLIAALDAKIGK